MSTEAPCSHVGKAAEGSCRAGRRFACISHRLLGKKYWGGIRNWMRFDGHLTMCLRFDLIRRGRGGRLTLVLR
jgi:hypothetical protein